MTTDSQPESRQPESRQINLQQVAGQFMGGLQRHFDMLAYNIASRDAVTEEAHKAIGFAENHAGCARPPEF